MLEWRNVKFIKMTPELANFTIYGHTFAIYFYGVFMLLAIIVATLILYLELRRHNLEIHRILDNIFWIVLFGLIGARLGFASLHWSFYVGQPWELIKFWQGGLVFSGGLLVGIVVAVVWLWTRERHQMWGWLDSAMIAATFGHAIGMLGSFFSAIDIGRPTDLPWGVNFAILNESILRHPTQLYEFAAYALVGLILLIFSHRRQQGIRDPLTFSGSIFFSGLTLMALVRLMVEFVREPMRVFFVTGGIDITSAHFSSLILLVCGIIGIGWRSKKNYQQYNPSNKRKDKVMNEEKLAELKKKLETKKQNLEEQLSKIAKKDDKLKDDYDAQFENFDNEVMDISNEATEVSNYQNKLSLEATLELQLRDVNKALEKMEKGEYGKCDKCDGEIKLERLEALPHATICLDCSNK